MALRWIEEARTFLGLKEIKGPKHAQAILDMWKAIKRGGIKDDETRGAPPSSGLPGTSRHPVNPL